MEVRNSYVTSKYEYMSMYFSITEIDQKYGDNLNLFLKEANSYEGEFKLHIRDGVIRYISYDTDYSDDWLCHGMDTFAEIINDCISELYSPRGGAL